MNTTRSDHQSGCKGVNWNSTTQRWRVLVPNKKGYEILGSFAEADLDKAIAMKHEAEGLHPSEYPALKAKYGVGRKGRPKGHPWGHPAAQPTTQAENKEIIIAPAIAPAPILSNDPAVLLQAAEAADADAHVAQQAAERANQTAIEAIERASTLWARLAAVLRVRHQDSLAFKRSPLGGPNGQDEPDK